MARADVVEGRRLVSGVLGCPVCHVERAVAGGVVYWHPGAGIPGVRTGDPPPDIAGDALLRAAALIGLTESVAPLVLCGTAGLAAAGFIGMVGSTLVLLDPPDDRAAPVATIVRGAPRVPLGARSVRAIMLDSAWSVGADSVASAVRALMPRGRIVAAVATPLPAGVRELARDDREWVAEREPNIVQIRRPAGR